ncbi:MAG TPA: 1-deoxy-D-xylulose-5-phosphate synthase, partial [Spirochaetota bacterium]|nr:1-deoxy-D-xylulose-5-phosphate synthase [Spirochaetota bacterium]
ISQAIGFALANKLKNINNHIAVIIGDGALTGGVAFEGLNFTGHRDLPLIIILNDNEMSIGENVGSVSRHFAELTLSKPYQKLTDIYTNVMKKRRGIIKFFFWFAKNVERVLKLFLGYENIFLNLGFEYIGPLDGHNINQLINIFSKIKNNVHRPILIHVKTVKGKGYGRAENNPSDFHGVTPYQMANGKSELKDTKSFTDIFSDKIVKLSEQHNNIIGITAAMEEGTGLKKFKERFPDKFFDVGIAEQHAVSMASTLAYSGLRPVFAVYSTFLQRAIDQVVQDICISSAPVIFAIDRAGIVGTDGETHQGQFDISFLRMIPNIMILAPSDSTELELMLDYAYSLKTPVAIRYPRDIAVESQLDNKHPDIETNPFVIVKEGVDVLIIVIGPFVTLAKEVISTMEDKKLSCGILYLRVLKPIDDEKIYTEIAKYKKVIVIEENVFSGSVSQYIG